MLWCIAPLAIVGVAYGVLFWLMGCTVADAPTQ